MSIGTTRYVERVNTSPEVLFEPNLARLGTETYAFFEGEGEYRTAQKQAFLKDEIRNPRLDYPGLDPLKIHEQEHALNGLLNDAEHISADEEINMAYWAATGYRLAESYYLLESFRLNSEPDMQKRALAAERFMRLGAELYGMPEKPLFDSAVAEVWRQIDEKELDGSAENIKNELESLLFRPTTTETIPALSKEAITYYKNRIDEKFADEKEIVDNHWQRIQEESKQTDRPEEFIVKDILAVFEEVNQLRGGEAFGVTVELVDGTSIAFSIKDRKLKVGDKHANIQTPEKMFGRVVHEYGVHVGRFINGLKDGNYASATGHAGYIQFEEGLASVFEQIANGKTEKLGRKNLDHYINIGLALGLDRLALRDFRDVFEICWRFRTLMRTKPDSELTDVLIEEEKKYTYDRTVKRIFRGTPCDLPGVVYTKDLAYLPGRIKATKFLESHAGDDQSFDMLFAGKVDPTIELQARVVAKGDYL